MPVTPKNRITRKAIMLAYTCSQRIHRCHVAETLRFRAGSLDPGVLGASTRGGLVIGGGNASGIDPYACCRQLTGIGQKRLTQRSVERERLPDQRKRTILTTASMHTK